MKTKDILCDSGTLISLTSTCLDHVLYFFAERHGVRVIIPPMVEYECITRPMRGDLKKFMFSAIRIQDLINDGIVVKSEPPSGEGANRIMDSANNLFYVGGKPLRLVHFGEAEMVAVAKMLGINYILMDERTMRLLIESPISLKKHFEQEFGTNVMVNKKNLAVITEQLRGLHVLRSSELLMLAYENGFFQKFQNMENEAMKAALYKVKFSGCSIRMGEIEEYARWKG